MHSSSLSLQVRARSLFWQQLLRRSVALYLVLAQPSAPVRGLERAQRKVERRLLHYLVRHLARTPEVEAEAQAVLERAQVELLADTPPGLRYYV